MAQDLQLNLQIRADGTAAVTGLNQVRNAVDGVGDTAHNSQRSIDALGGSLGSLISAAAVVAAAEKFIEYNRALESTKAALVQLTGSQQAADETLARIADTADRLGQSTLGLAEQYIQLAAATKNTALEGAATDAVFNSIVGAMGKLGKSSAETSRALAAVAQMASKGVVSAEELRGQLGEALPGAMQALSQATGITVTDLNKMMEAGTLMAADVLPALAKGLNDTFGSDTAARVETLGASVERMKNTIVGAFTTLGESGVSKGLVWALDKAEYAVRGVTAATVGMVQLGATNLAAMTDAVTGGERSWETYKETVSDLADKWTDYVVEGDKGTVAVQKNADATEAAAIAALKSASAYTEASKSAADNVTLSEKQTAATNAAAASSERWVKVLGTEKDQLDTLVQGIANRLTSMQKEAADKQKLQVVDQARILQMQTEVEQAKAIGEAEGKTAEQITAGLSVRVKQIEELGKTTAARQAEIDKLGKEIDSQAAAQVAAQLAAKTYGDQSTQLAELTDERDRLTRANDAAVQKVEALKAANLLLLRQQKDLRQAQEDGLNVGEALDETNRQLADSTAAVALGERDAKDAAKALAESKKLVIDALRDTQEKLKAEADAIADQVEATNTLLEIKGIELQRRKSVAEAMGDERAAASLNIQSMRLELQELNNNAEALHTRADLGLKAAEARKQELEESGKYEGALKAETEAQLRDAEAMELAAQKLDATSKAKRTEISIAAQLIDAQNAVNAVVEEYGQILAQAGEEAKKAGEAAIAAGANQYEAAEAAKRAAQAALDAAEQKVKADRESIAYTDLIATELAGLADQYEALGDTSTAAMLRSKEALGDYWQMWEAGRYPQEIQSLNEQLTHLGQRVAYVDNLTAALQSGSYSAAQLAEATRIAQTATERLGAERLEALRSAIQAAQQDMADLREEAEDTLKSWQDKLDQLRGNQLDIAARQRLSDLADLQAQLDAAVAAGNAEAAANIRAAIDAAKAYWDEYIAGLQDAQEAADNANLPGITVNDDGTISGTLPITRTGGGSGDGTASGALNTSRASSASGTTQASIAREDMVELSRTIGDQISSALSQSALELQASSAAQRTVRLDFNLEGQSVSITTSSTDADKVIAAWADAKRRGL